MSEKQVPLHCRYCKHFQISWDPKRPYACKIFDIKSQQLPMTVVKMASGHDCTGFEKKEEKKPHSYF